VAKDRKRKEAEITPSELLIILAALLKEALAIEHDLTGRLSQHPKLKSLLKQHLGYQELVDQLTWELERPLASYLRAIKAVSASGAGAAMGPSGPASAASRYEIRTPAQRT
jgi:hypothetical protein